jgi:hypothetical protein
MLQVPSAAVIAAPIWVTPSDSLTSLPASARPFKVGATTLVTLSLLDKPLSEAATMSSFEGAAGALVSIVTDRVPEAMLELPAKCPL